MKYVAAVDWFPNCPVCDSGYYDKLIFFSNLKDILKYAVENMNSYGLRSVYSCKTGKELFDLIYDSGRHSHVGVQFKHKGLKLRTYDDGAGKLVWRKNENP